MNPLLSKAESGGYLTRADLVELLALPKDDPDFQALLDIADRVRERTMGDGVYLRGIIEFSNICRVDCHYCGIRRSNKTLQRYRMPVDVIVDTAKRAEGLGYGSVVLQSGEGDALPPDELAEAVRRIKAETGLAVTLSVGERTKEEYAYWKQAGADRYLLRHETSDPELFARLRPGRTLAQRLQCLQWLRETGYQVGSGFMVGLPGQSLASLAGDIDLLRELHVEMAGIGPFIPGPETPLAGEAGGTVEMALKCVALTRICIPDAHLPATTALGSIHPMGRQLALNAGANIIMPNVTPASYRENYQLYPNKICLLEEPEHCAPCVAGLIASQGRYVATGQGHSPRVG
ncbi:MAG: putative biotin synthetase [Symbiobacteriaceae bacterium]|jgi:biotin synthase|nr:putative biotin synthetase [Symbiobacteriaceae bacterium]